jgi:hypothetical protein
LVKVGRIDFTRALDWERMELLLGLNQQVVDF